MEKKCITSKEAYSLLRSADKKVMSAILYHMQSVASNGNLEVEEAGQTVNINGKNLTVVSIHSKAADNLFIADDLGETHALKSENFDSYDLASILEAIETTVTVKERV